ncbi:TolC family protein [Pedobacter sandarakinus]|uniref:TolC family protein n=1 Tax=Pedobacter sandarakinus TaxID=353156 RepID=UPI00224606C9|nr:TolC family protein [Pedobacter sandarakinus]MCX2573093.1 TolC family protein [Pedobacter sandarakinus]
MKMFTKNKLVTGSALLIATSLGLSAGAQQVITIEQAVENTLKNNLNIKQAAFSAAISEEDLRQSKNALLPSLNGSVNQSMQWGRSQQVSGLFENTQNYNLNPNLNANVTLFGGGTKLNQIRQNKFLLDASKTNVEKVKNDLVLQVVTAYLQVLNNQDQVKATEQQLEVANSTLKREQALLDVGNKTLADISQAKSQAATAELNLTNAQNQLTIAYLTLGQLMEIQPPMTFKVQPPLVDEVENVKSDYVPNDIYKQAMDAFPDIRLAWNYSKAAEKAVDVARGSFFPQISLGGGLGSAYYYRFNANPLFPNAAFTNQLSDNFGQFVSMGIQIPIFNGFSTRSNVRRAKINLQQRRTDEALAKNNLIKVINQAVADLNAAKSRYSSTHKAFQAQKDAFYVIDQRYNVGLVNSLDYSTAQTNRNRAEIDFILAKYDLIFRAKVIDYYLGKQITF